MKIVSWKLVAFDENDNEINVNTTNPEFIEWKWIDISLLPDLIVRFKKHVYETVLIELKKIVS